MYREKATTLLIKNERQSTFFIDNFIGIGTITNHYLIYICRGSSVVEREPEELSVVGSIPTSGTKKQKRSAYV